LGAWTSCGVAAHTGVDGVVCLGYPLTEPHERVPARAEPLVELSVPGLVVYGSEDPLCPREVLQHVIKPNSHLTSYTVVESDHSLGLKGPPGSQDDAERGVCDAVEEFLHTKIFGRQP
jgi:predicted alpha/beta-hydrolase family hydrolase